MADYPALALQSPNIVGGFLQGAQVAQDMQSQRVRNQLLMQEQAQRQAAMQRDEQFRNVLAQSVGPMAAQAAASPAEQASNYLMQGTQNPLVGPSPDQFNQLMQLDPERAFQMQAQFEQMRQRRQQELVQRAGQAVRAAQFVAKSKDPKRTLEIGFPEMVEQLKAQGVSLDELDDDMVKAMAGDVIAQFGPIAGVGPAQGENPFAQIDPSKYTSESVAKFEQTGNYGDLVALTDPDKDPNDKKFSRANTLRNQYDSRVDGFKTIRSAYENVQNAEANDTGDTQLVLNAMRVMSPGLRLQPGERIEDAASVPGVPAGAIQLWNKVVGGGKLNDSQRDEIRSQAKRTYQTQRRLAQEERARYTNLAKTSGLEPYDVVGDDFAPVAEFNAQGVRTFDSIADAEAAGLKPGTPIIVAGRKARWE